MYDIELVKEILRQLLGSAHTIAKRFASINSSSDFVISESGYERLDSICMQLIAIGEGVKHLDQVTEGVLLSNYPNVEWKQVMGMRDMLSHHYFDIDEEVVYTVCLYHIEPLILTLKAMQEDLEKQ